VLTLPIPLRFLCAADTRALSEILACVQHCLAAHLIERAHLTKRTRRLTRKVGRINPETQRAVDVGLRLVLAL
jgi:hypothetical protein